MLDARRGVGMRLGNIIEFKKELYFEGAVQSDWFYEPQKAAKVAENFVFHGKNYFGVDSKKDSIDTVSLVRALVNKLGKDDVNPRTLAIADYGTGKSHLAVTLGQIFSGAAYMPETYDKILQNIRQIDPEAAEDIRELSKDRNFVIMLNGIRDFNLHSEILKATQRSLRLYGIDDSELKNLNKTIETANRFFELNADSRVCDFEKAASERGWNETSEALISRLKNSLGSDDAAFEIVNDVYELATGQRIRWEEGISAKAILEMLLNKLCGLNGRFDNVVILFDEFGRFLEYASGTDGGKCGDNALQEIFEVSQNAAGMLQIINFIQTDIKTYLLRVDQSRNLSRYIGRYDESEKFHISSNLETVFANLIARNDITAFQNTVVKWLDEKEESWKNVYNVLNKWTHTTGIWADYRKFRKVIVEGIYPMHPIAVFMLTQLSDYLQNRSSMTLISRYISDVSDIDLNDSIPHVLPETLMQGDLFTEMLAAETSGRHRSDYCIRYENVLKKNDSKLDEVAKKILRANLVTRTLRFNTRSYEEAVESLVLCSGLSKEQVEDALHILVEEYAVMAFDEMSGCFDFTEDAKGAYDYKIMKRRLLSARKVDIRKMLSTASILEIGEFGANQLTNFNTVHKITTNEWCFTQEVMLAEDMTTDLAKKYIRSWRTARSVTTPKGRLIWLYLNKDSDYQLIENLREISQQLNGTPIIMLLLNDTDNMLQNILTEYDVLENMDAKAKEAYNMIYIKDKERVLDNLKNIFEALKKRREQVTIDGIVQLKKRLPVALTEVFETLYPEIISYNFDGLLTQGNNFAGNGIKYYCQILKMFLANKVNEDTIHDFQIEIRNRIQALFMTSGLYSWKCITLEYAIVSPLNEKARAIYDAVEKELHTNESYNCNLFFEKYCDTPYGLSEETAAMFLAMVITNLWHNVRVEYNHARTTVVEWKDNIVEDKKLHIDRLKKSVLLWVDTGSIESKFAILFKKIDDNQDILEAKRLRAELDNLIIFYGLPEAMDTHKRLADRRFKDFDAAENMWNTRIEDVQNELDSAESKADVYKAIEAYEMIDGISIASIFTQNKIQVSDEYRRTPSNLKARADKIIKTYFGAWLDQSVYCKSVDNMNGFEKWYTRVSQNLTKYGYNDFARQVISKGEKELRNKAEIKSRQELVDDGRRFVKICAELKPNDYVETKRQIKNGNEWIERFKKYGSSLGKQALIVGEEVQSKINLLISRKEKMDNNMASIFDAVAEANSVESLDMASDCLQTVLSYTLNNNDKEQFVELQKLISDLQEDVKRIEGCVGDRQKFEEISNEFKIKYSNEEMEYDFSLVIQDCVTSTADCMERKDKLWRSENLTLGKETRQDVYEWKDRIKVLPKYLSESTKAAVASMDKRADEIISDGKIEDVLQFFKKLSTSERRKCLDILKQMTD